MTDALKDAIRSAGIERGIIEAGAPVDESELIAIVRCLAMGPKETGAALRPCEGESKDAKDAARYRWLRDQPRKSKGGRPMDAPFVMNRRQSALYAIAEYRAAELDRAVDEDRLNDMCNFIAYEMKVNGDERFADPNWQFSDEFTAICEAKAREALGWTAPGAQTTEGAV